MSAAPAVAACGQGGYGYAGLVSAQTAGGIAATVSAVTEPQVEAGHVAAWVGVGGYGLGPGGADEWIQVGLSAVHGSEGRLYFEVKRPGAGPRYVEFSPAVETGESHRVAVIERADRPGFWQVWIDGRAVSAPVRLPGSHGRFFPVATAESWDGGVSACNRFGYRFDLVSLATGPGEWRPLGRAHPLHAPGFRVVRGTAASFVAAAPWIAPRWTGQTG